MPVRLAWPAERMEYARWARCFELTQIRLVLGFAKHFIELLGNADEGGALGEFLELVGADVGAG
jgi:hypothetical protein